MLPTQDKLLRSQIISIIYLAKLSPIARAYKVLEAVERRGYTSRERLADDIVPKDIPLSLDGGEGTKRFSEKH